MVEENLREINEKNNVLTKVFSLLITLSVIGILVMAGPASAFNLKIDLGKQTVVQGEELSFYVTIDLGDYSVDNVKHLKLKLKGEKIEPSGNDSNNNEDDDDRDNKNKTKEKDREDDEFEK